MNRKATHIALFFLTLSVSFIFPIQYWHSCSNQAVEQTHAYDLHGEGALMAEAQAHCYLCDWEFVNAVFVPEMVCGNVSVYMLQDFFPHYAIPPLFRVETPLLRGPPLG